jgi:hypothetical protein
MEKFVENPLLEDISIAHGRTFNFMIIVTSIIQFILEIIVLVGLLELKEPLFILQMASAGPFRTAILLLN